MLGLKKYHNLTNMYETYLQNEREDLTEFYKIASSYFKNGCELTGQCSLQLGKVVIPDKAIYKCRDKMIEETEEFFKSQNRLSLIKVMKALEKELGGMRKENKIQGEFRDWEVHHTYTGYNEALQLSLDKIREFISKLEKEV